MPRTDIDITVPKYRPPSVLLRDDIAGETVWLRADTTERDFYFAVQKWLDGIPTLTPLPRDICQWGVIGEDGFEGIEFPRWPRRVSEERITAHGRAVAKRGRRYAIYVQHVSTFAVATLERYDRDFMRVDRDVPECTLLALESSCQLAVWTDRTATATLPRLRPGETPAPLPPLSSLTYVFQRPPEGEKTPRSTVDRLRGHYIVGTP